MSHNGCISDYSAIGKDREEKRELQGIYMVEGVQSLNHSKKLSFA
jgi:hypothetical protein